MNHEFITELARSLHGTTEVQHFDRRAFKTRSIYLTLGADDALANLKLDPHQQEHWCQMAGTALAPLPNKWGARGWTQLQLDRLSKDEIESLLKLAHSNTLARKRSSNPPDRSRL